MHISTVTVPSYEPCCGRYESERHHCCGHGSGYDHDCVRGRGHVPVHVRVHVHVHDHVHDHAPEQRQDYIVRQNKLGRQCIISSSRHAIEHLGAKNYYYAT